tara:strand:+ start:47 stop:250 length:204 start_codon:yes stop_codon:yes gene_type:complete
MPLELNQRNALRQTLCMNLGGVFRTLERSFLIIKLLRPRVVIIVPLLYTIFDQKQHFLCKKINIFKI